MEKDFISEIERYTISDLEYIYRTQQELYSEEEMEIIRDTIEKKKLVKDVVERKQPDDRTLTADYYLFVTIFCIISLVFPVSGAINGLAMIIAGFSKKCSPEWKGAGLRVIIAAVISIIIRAILGGGFSLY